jgi:hypothetical protein
VSVTMDLLAFDLMEGSLWMDVRAAQDPHRKFGAVPTAVWSAVHQLNAADTPAQTVAQNAMQFLHTTPASQFYKGEPVPAAH